MAPPPRSKRQKGKIVHGEARRMVLNILDICEAERNENRLKIPLWRPSARTALYSGLSISTVKRIKNQCKDGNEPSSPQEKRGGKIGFRTVLSEKDMCFIRREVQNFYYEHEKSPTAGKLLQILQEKLAFKWQRETMRQVLLEMGFKWRKCGILKQKQLIEKAEYVSSRTSFIRAIQEYRDQGYNTYYVDEVWIDQSLKLQRSWDVQKDAQGPVPDRLFLIHVGSADGFLKDAELIFESRTNNREQMMSSALVEKWVTEKLLPKLSTRSVIVMDSAAHHCVARYKRPSMYVSRTTMIKWLRKYEVDFDEQAPKGDLYSLIEGLKPREKIYKIDSLLTKNGHVVLRVPPYTCDLNAIELAWCKMESIIDENEIAGEFALMKLEALLRYAMESVTSDDWKVFVETTIDIEKEYSTRDEQMEHILENLMNQGSREDHLHLWNNDRWSSSSDSEGEANW